MVGVLQTVFRYMDMGITMTNRERAEAYIWQSVDEEDCRVIAELLIEAGKKNRIVATGVRRVATSYKLLQVGIITVPRFIQTYQHYAAHGGFTIFGGMSNANVPVERKVISGGQTGARSESAGTGGGKTS